LTAFPKSKSNGGEMPEQRWTSLNKAKHGWKSLQKANFPVQLESAGVG
jgi:hypothetical protein